MLLIQKSMIILLTLKSAYDLFQGLYRILLVTAAPPQTLMSSFYFEFTLQLATKRAIMSLKLLVFLEYLLG